MAWSSKVASGGGLERALQVAPADSTIENCKLVQCRATFTSVVMDTGSALAFRSLVRDDEQLVQVQPTKHTSAISRRDAPE
jgi:hypothetical protein